MSYARDAYELMFQHTAARRRLTVQDGGLVVVIEVSTHSRAKAAEPNNHVFKSTHRVSTHSRAKAAEIMKQVYSWDNIVSTHSRAKAAD